MKQSVQDGPKEMLSDTESDANAACAATGRREGCLMAASLVRM